MSLVTLLSALLQIGIENVALVLFGHDVKIVKLGGQSWDAVAMYVLLRSLDFESTASIGTMDAPAIHCCLDLLALSGVRGPKKVFVLTDGYSSCGLQATAALKRADDEDVDVVGIAVGLDKSGVAQLYRRWIRVALPMALPDAFRCFYEQDSLGESPSAEVADWSRIRMDNRSGGGKLEDAFRNPTTAYPNLLKELSMERDLNIVRGAGAGSMTLDLCLVVDLTGSMQAWLGSIKANLAEVLKSVGPAVREKFPDLRLRIRYSALGYRDVKDVPQFIDVPFDTKAFGANAADDLRIDEADADRVAAQVRAVVCDRDAVTVTSVLVRVLVLMLAR
jgi:hypothetical protein